MNIQLSMMGIDGHTEVTFQKDEIRIYWSEAALRERKMLRRLVESAKDFGLTAHSVGDDDKATKGEAKLPGLFSGKRGWIALKGDSENIKKAAKALVDADIDAGGMAFEMQDDGTCKVLKKGEFEPKIQKEGEEEKKQKVTTTKAVGGG